MNTYSRENAFNYKKLIVLYEYMPPELAYLVFEYFAQLRLSSVYNNSLLYINYINVYNNHIIQYNPVFCDNILSIAVIDKNTFICGGRNKTLTIWNDISCTHILNHECIVNDVAVNDDNIISCGDNIIKIWSRETMTCNNVLRGHNARVNAVGFFNQNVISCSNDKTIKIWNKNNNVNHTLQHSGTVYNIAVQNINNIVSCGDNIIWLWDVNTGHLQDIKEYKGYISCVASIDDHQIISGCNNMLKIWDKRCNAGIQTMTEHVDCISAIIVHNPYYIISSSHDESIKIWDKRMMSSIQTLKTPSFVNDIALINEQCIISASGDDKCMIWSI